MQNSGHTYLMSVKSVFTFILAATLFSTSTAFTAVEPSLIFDLPMTYNKDVQKWVKYFQNGGRPHFKKWLERSGRYFPKIRAILKQEGLPQDLAYMAMIESGLSPFAASHAQAVGPWQFIEPTATRFGLRVNTWLDERRDFDKSTHAAAKYLKFLHGTFQAWHLAAAGYNSGENHVLRSIQKSNTRNFWKLSQNKVLYEETRNYVPKLIAAILIAKAPSLYGFRNLAYQEPHEAEKILAPGGTDLDQLADHLGVQRSLLRELNTELVRGNVPYYVRNHMIRVPRQKVLQSQTYLRKKLAIN